MLKCPWVRTLLIFIACSGGVLADDIDASLPASGTVFLHVLMDLGDSEVDASLCTYGMDCFPPFFSANAHTHLAHSFEKGDSVTAPAAFRAVLAAIFDEPAFADMNVALLIANHHENALIPGDSRTGGGTILHGYHPLVTARREVQSILASIPVVGGVDAHQFQPQEASLEWLRYVRGQKPVLGTNTSGNFGTELPYPDFDTTIIAAGQYVEGIPAQHECPRLVSILYTQGAPHGDTDLNTEIAREVSPAAAASFEGWLDAVLNGSVDLLPSRAASVVMEDTWVVSQTQRDTYAKQYALSADTPLLHIDHPGSLERELRSRLMALVTQETHVLGASFVTNSPGFGQNLQDAFFAMSEAGSGVAWRGNVKKLKIDAIREQANTDQRDQKPVGLGNSQFVDANGAPAFELAGAREGRLRFDSLTFWTEPLSLPEGDGKFVPVAADGGLVARGGAGQKIDGFVGYRKPSGETAPYHVGDSNDELSPAGESARQIFVEPISGSQFIPFNADTRTTGELSELIDPDAQFSEAEKVELVRWARGQSLTDEAPAARNWLLGEVLHSKPLAINYGATKGYSAENPNVRIFFGSGDGLFHVLENTDTDGNDSGRELFAFYPRDMLPNLRLLRENTRSARQKLYGVDGAPSVLLRDVNRDGTLQSTMGDKAIVFFGLRRGGSSYYAVDVSDPDAAPKLLWSITRTSGGSFDELGLTFSKPVVARVRYDGMVVDALIFGGGYAGGWSDDLTTREGKDAGAADDTVGNALYIVNAHTGALIWKAVHGETGTASNSYYQHAGMVDSIPSKVTVLKSADGIVHRVYVGDTGGSLWRVDLASPNEVAANQRRDHWFVTKLADLGADAEEGNGTTGDDRRFFHAPDLVHSMDSIGKFDGVIIQSGNRADPNGKSVSDYLFYVKDRFTRSGDDLVRQENSLSHPAGRYDFMDIPEPAVCVSGSESNEPGCDAQALSRGWKLRFNQPGEKGLSTPLVDAGKLYVSTYIPPAFDQCRITVGSGRLYVLRLSNGVSIAGSSGFHDLGPGIPGGVTRIGELLYIPGAGINVSQPGEPKSRSKLIPSNANKLYSLYWREPAIDPL